VVGVNGLSLATSSKQHSTTTVSPVIGRRYSQPRWAHAATAVDSSSAATNYVWMAVDKEDQK